MPDAADGKSAEGRRIEEFGLVLVAGWAGLAAGQNNVVPDPVTDDKPPSVGRADRLRQRLTLELDEMAETADRILVDAREEEPADERARAQSRASLITTFHQDGAEVTGRFNARLTLPRATRVFQILLDDHRPDQYPDPFEDPLHRMDSDRWIERIPGVRMFKPTYGLRVSLSLRPMIGPFIVTAQVFRIQESEFRMASSGVSAFPNTAFHSETSPHSISRAS